MASVISIVASASTAAARRSLAGLSSAARRVGREVESSAHRMANAGEDAWRRIGRGATRLWSTVAEVGTRALSALSEHLMEAGKNLGMLGVKAGGAVAALLPLVATIGNLLGLLILIPGAITAGVVAMSIFKLGLNGIQEALEAGLSGDLEEFEKQLKKLSPHAQDFVRKTVELAPAFRELRSAVQDALFFRFADLMDKLGKKLLPVIKGVLPGIAMGLNHAAHEIVALVTSEDGLAMIDRILKAIHDTIWNLVGVARPLLQVFLDLTDVGTTRVKKLTGGVTELAEKFAAWVRDAKESGKLAEWLERGLDTLKQLGRIAGNVGDILKTLWSSGQDDSDTMLDSLEEMTKRLADFLDSRRGKDFLAMMGDIMTILVWMGEQAAILSGMWSVWFAGMKELWKGFALYAVQSFGVVINGLVSVFGKIPGIGTLLKEAQANFAKFADGVTKSLMDIPNRTIYVDVRYNDPGRAVPIQNNYQSGIGGRAHGGPASGLTRLHELGPEIMKLPSGTMVYPTGQYKQLAQEWGSGGGATTITVKPDTGGSNTLMRALIEALRFEIDRRGGLSAAFGR